MTRLISLFFIGLCCTAVFGQAEWISTNSTVQDKTATNHVTVNLLEQAAEDFFPALYSLESPSPGGTSYKSYLQDVKLGDRSEFPEQGIRQIGARATSAPEVGVNMGGNAFSGVPADNHLAISNDGYILSVVNSTIWIEKLNASFSPVTISLENFAAPFEDLDAHFYDPKVLYDANRNRFIVIFLHGTTEAENAIVVGFSKTSNPTGDWDLYTLDGTPFDDGTWSDYPMAVLSDRELFLTVNLVVEGVSWQEGFSQTLIWQIDKDQVFDSGDLFSKMHSDISYGGQPIRNIMPVKGGSETYGYDMYFLSNRNFSEQNDTIFLLKTEGVYLFDPEVQVSVLTPETPYGVPPDAIQPFFEPLSTNDARILGSYYQDNDIHFVQNCMMPDGQCGIYHGMIRDVEGSRNIEANYITTEGIHFGYPNISYASFDGLNSDPSMISFDYSGPEVAPGMGAVVYANGAYSSMTMVKEGAGYLDVMDGADRWGDYSGSQLKYDEPGTIWVSGTYSTAGGLLSENFHSTWVAELKHDNISESVSVAEIDEERMILSPVPANNELFFDFELSEADTYNFSIMNSLGQVVKEFYTTKVKAGKNRFQFDTSPLTPGVYFLQIVNQGNNRISKRFIKE